MSVQQCEYVLRRAGRFLLLFGALALPGPSGADEPPGKLPPRSIRDITALLDQYKPDPAKAAEVRKILDQPAPDIRDGKDLGRFYKQKAMTASEVGAAGDYVAAMRKVVEFGGDWDIAEDIHLLAGAEAQAGNLQRAIAAYEEVLSKIEPNSGKRHGAYSGLVRIHIKLGDVEMAKGEAEALGQQYANSVGARRGSPGFTPNI